MDSDVGQAEQSLTTPSGGRRLRLQEFIKRAMEGEQTPRDIDSILAATPATTLTGKLAPEYARNLPKLTAALQKNPNVIEAASRNDPGFLYKLLTFFKSSTAGGAYPVGMGLTPEFRQRLNVPDIKMWSRPGDTPTALHEGLHSLYYSKPSGAYSGLPDEKYIPAMYDYYMKKFPRQLSGYADTYIKKGQRPVEGMGEAVIEGMTLNSLKRKGL